MFEVSSTIPSDDAEVGRVADVTDRLTAADAGRIAAVAGLAAGVEGRGAADAGLVENVAACATSVGVFRLAEVGIIWEATSRLFERAVAGLKLAAVAGRALDARADMGRPDCARADGGRTEAGRAVAGRAEVGGVGSGVEGGDGHDSQCQSFLLVVGFCLRTL